MSQELQNYISQARKVGKSDEEIVKGLKLVGWEENQITRAIGIPTPSKLDNDPPKISQTIKKTVKPLLIFCILLLTAVLAYAALPKESISYTWNSDCPDGHACIPEGTASTEDCMCFGFVNDYVANSPKSCLGLNYACKDQNDLIETQEQTQSTPATPIPETNPTVVPEATTSPTPLPDYAQSGYTAPTQEKLTDQEFYDLVDTYRTQLGGNWGTGNYSGSVEDAGNNVYSVSVGSPEPVPFFVGFYKGQWVVAHQEGVYWCELLRRTNYSDQVKMRLGVMQCSTQ